MTKDVIEMLKSTYNEQKPFDVIIEAANLVKILDDNNNRLYLDIYSKLCKEYKNNPECMKGQSLAIIIHTDNYPIFAGTTIEYDNADFVKKFNSLFSKQYGNVVWYITDINNETHYYPVIIEKVAEALAKDGLKILSWNEMHGVVYQISIDSYDFATILQKATNGELIPDENKEKVFIKQQKEN